MNNYQDEEAGFIKTQIQERIVTWGKFIFFLLVGFLFLIISFPFSSALLVNPGPFTFLFSLGSLMLLIGLLQIVELKAIVKSTGSLTGTIIYLLALCAGIYSGIFRLGYFNTLLVMLFQVSPAPYPLDPHPPVPHDLAPPRRPRRPHLLFKEDDE